MSAISYMKKVTIWKAIDSTKFSNAADCITYESKINPQYKEYLTITDYLKDIYARVTVQLYKHYLTKMNNSWSCLLRSRQDYGYKIAHWVKILENNRAIWDYTKVPANIPLSEFIYNRNLIQSNCSEVVQIYLPKKLLTLDVLEDVSEQVKYKVNNIEGFYKVRIEYVSSTVFRGASLYLYTLTNKNKLTYEISRSLYDVYSIKAYVNDTPTTLKEQYKKLIIDLQT